MMRAGTDFTYQNRRYQAGDRFDLRSVPAHLQGTLIRLYKLEPVRKPKLTREENT